MCVDAACAENKNKSSQSGIIVMLRDMENGNANIINYSACKSKRVYKSVLASELFAMVEGFDVGFAVAHSLKGMLERTLSMTIYTDSESLYSLCTSLSQMTERRLRIDLSLIRETYESREITDIVWIAEHLNPVDDLTKTKTHGGMLAWVVETNHFLSQAQSWILRDLKLVSTHNGSNSNECKVV